MERSTDDTRRSRGPGGGRPQRSGRITIAVTGSRQLPISPRQMAGFRAVCRQGGLGTIVDVGEEGRPAANGEILVRSESSGRCYYHVPLSAIRSVSPRRMEVLVGLLVTDFVPREDGDGSIDLFVPEPRSHDD